MAICKLCRSVMEPEKVSTADKNLCKQCHGDMIKYRRYTGLQNLSNPDQIAFVDRMEEMFKRNLENGWFVPKAYLMPVVTRKCLRCLKDFQTKTSTIICHECRKKELSYYVLDRNSPNSKTLAEYDKYYAKLHEQGKPVPKLYFKRARLHNHQNV